MQVVKFDKCNTVIGASNDESLPAYKDTKSSEAGFVICYRLSFLDRIKILFKGRLFVSIITFGDAVQPTTVSTEFVLPRLKVTDEED